MMTRTNKTIIQAMPLSKDTKVINAGDVFAPNKDNVEVIHASEDSMIKATFNDNTNQDFVMTTGMDMSIGDDVISIECLSGSLIAG